MKTDYVTADMNFTLFDRINAITDCSFVAFASIWPMTLNAVKFGLFGLPIGIGLHLATTIMSPSATRVSPLSHGELIWGIPALIFIIAWLVFFIVDYLLPRRINRQLRRTFVGIADFEPVEINFPTQFRFSYKGHVFESGFSSFMTLEKYQRYQRHRFVTLIYYYHNHHYQWRTYEKPLLQSYCGKHVAYYSQDSQCLLANMAWKQGLTEDVFTDCLDKLVSIITEHTVIGSADVIASNFPKEIRSVRLDHVTLTFDGKTCKIAMTKKDKICEMIDRLFSSKFLLFTGFSLTFACAFLNLYAFSLFIIVCALSYILIVFLMKDFNDLSCRAISYEDLSYIILNEDDGYLRIDYKYHTISRRKHSLIENCDIEELKGCLPKMSKHIEKTVYSGRKKIWLIPITSSLFNLIIFIVLRYYGELTRSSLFILFTSIFVWIIYAIGYTVKNKKYY